MAAPSPYQLLATTLTVGAASAARTGVGCLEVCAERLPRLIALARSGARREDPASARSTGELRDELIEMARACAEVAVRELGRGVEDMDEFTRPDGDTSTSPTRPYRTKP